MFSPLWREQALARLDESFDLVIVGGGITGCGALLDAAQRGLRVLLVERGDIASGTSSRSSKLIHGGLRYLRQRRIRLTRLACRERDRLAALNPHLVEPLRFLHASYEGDKLPGWQVELGLRIYDRLTRGRTRHQALAADRVGELAPGLATANLDRALSFADARTDDARLTLAVAATGYAYGGRILSRCAVEEGRRDATGRIAGVVLRDLESGSTRRVAARVVLNAAGHWVDEVRRRFGLEDPRVRPSRGSHLIFDRKRLPIRAAVSVASPDDARPVFLVPHPEGVLVGTTDTYHDGPPDDPRATRQEVGYLLRAAQAAFPGRRLGEEDVLGVFAGLRPILGGHAEDPSKASREEEIWEERGILSVAGGKLTTYRSTAEAAVDKVIELLPEERTRSTAPSLTAGTPLVGLAPPELDRELVRSRALSPPVATGMARRLGSLAWTACGLASEPRDLAPLADGIDLSAAEVKAHLRFGGVLHLEDLLLRRVRLGMWRPAMARELVGRLQLLFTSELGWSPRRWEAEVEAFAAALEGWTREGAA